MQAETLSRLPTLVETQVAVDDEFPCFSCEDGNSAACEPFLDDIDGDQSLEDLLAIHGYNPSKEVLTAFSAAELLSGQLEDPFCVNMPRELGKGEVVSLPVDEKGVSIRLSTESPQTVIPKSLQAWVLHLSHFPTMAGHPGGRKMYYLLLAHF